MAVIDDTCVMRPTHILGPSPLFTVLPHSKCTCGKSVQQQQKQHALSDHFARHNRGVVWHHATLLLCMVDLDVVAILQATKLTQDEYIAQIDAEEIKTLVDIDYNPNKHRHIAYKAQDVMNWVLQPWYKQMLSMNHLLVRHMCAHWCTVQMLPVEHVLSLYGELISCMENLSEHGTCMP